MIIVGVTDSHGDTRVLDRLDAELAAADVVILAGDITSFGDRKDVERVIHAFRARCKLLLAVSGNCDPPAVGQYIDEIGIGLHGRNRTINGVVFVGLGGSLPCLGRTPNENTEDQLERMLECGADGIPPDVPMVLISHEPPYNTAIDNARYGGHVGSVSVRTFIEQYQPLLCISGHIHESRGIDAIGPTRIVNPGPLRDGKYAYAEVTGKLEVLEIRSC
jgi:hypothetical protein